METQLPNCLCPTMLALSQYSELSLEPPILPAPLLP